MKTTEEIRKLLKDVTISPALAEHLDEIYPSEPLEEGDNPVHHAASELSSLFLGNGETFEDFARSIDDDPVNGLHTDSVRELALYLLHAVDRYVAARQARYGAPEGVYADVPEDDDEYDGEDEDEGDLGDDEDDDCDA